MVRNCNSCGHFCSQCHCKDSSREAGIAATKAEAAKHWKYYYDVFNNPFQPITTETTAWCVWWDHCPFFEWFHKGTCWYVWWPQEEIMFPSVLVPGCIQRENAASLLTCVQVWSCFGCPCYVLRVPCKRQSSVNRGAWLQRFNDVTGVAKTDVLHWAMRTKR